MNDGPAEPVITIAVSDALARIEAKVDNINVQLVAKADANLVHEIDRRVAVLETNQTVASALAAATEKSRSRVWLTLAALGTAVGGLAAIVGLFISHTLT
jgi:hypothetical protein